jgi:ABC-2 type transport system ATP-binding protein
MFESVWATVTFSRGLWGKWDDPAYIEKLLKDLSLWDKKDAKLMTLSGGMKRRVLIAKALSHEPSILFLDEPTAGVDVELRNDMWENVRSLRESGVTIILTTHYINEAEDMADRIGVINKGELILVEDKTELMHKLGRKQLTLQLHQALDAIPAELDGHHLALVNGGSELVYTYDTQGPRTGITGLLTDLSRAGIRFKDLDTTQSSLEDIFVDLVRRDRCTCRRSQQSTNSRWRAGGAPSCKASCPRSSPRHSISWCSARPSARASPRSTACPTACSSCPAWSC